MRRPLPLLAVLATLALAAPAAADEPRIASGVSAGGTDVSGLTIPEAGQRIYDADAPLLGRPLSVHALGLRFGLRMPAIGLKLDIAKSARRAYQAGLAKTSPTVDVPLAVTFRRSVVDKFAARVARRIARPPHNATIRITLRRIYRLHSRPGRALNQRALAAAIAAAVVDPRAARILQPSVILTRPRITARDLPRAYPTVITIDRGNFRLRLFKRLRLVKSYPIAVGMPAHPTPTGLFSIQSKQVNPVWSVPNSPWAGELAGTTVQGGTAANPLKARWMGIANGVGIHGTGQDWSIGTRASHGCIRMHVWDVIDLYPRVPIGTPVLIGN